MPIPEPTFAQQSTALQAGWGYVQHIGDETNQRVALSRVWHGYILTAYRSNGSDNKVYFRFYDPYTQPQQNWLSGSPSAANLITQTPVALFYTNLTVYVFLTVLTDGNVPQLMYATAQQPTVASNNGAWNFTSLQFSNPQYLLAAVAPTLGPGVAWFGSSLYIAYGRSGSGLPVGSGSMVEVFVASIAQSGSLTVNSTFGVTGASPSFGSYISTTGEPTLVPFLGGLYCFYVETTSGNLRYVRVDQTAANSNAVQFNGTACVSDAAPGVTVDPTGTVLIVAYKDPGNNAQIWYTYTADLQNWASPQQVSGQQTSNAPALLSSDAGQVIMVYRDGTGNTLYSTNPTSFCYLPNGLNVVQAAN